MRKLFNKMQDGKGISFIYLFVLAYTILALVWWGVLLFMQSEQITRFEIQNLVLRTDAVAHPVEYHQELLRIEQTEHRRTIMFFGEGVIFLAIILLGGFFVYRAIYKQIMLSQQQQNFMMAVTHELKSPIAAVKLNLETIRRHVKLDDSKRDKLVDNTIRETNRLDQLCNNILLASQMESQGYELFREDLNFSDLLDAWVKEIADRITHHHIEAHILPGVWINGDKFMLQILLSNLLENAAKYAPKQTTINVSLTEEAGLLKLRVADEGPGIPLAERHKIFMKFYRIGNENTRKAKGSGLGLFLSEKIVQQHGGAIIVKDNTPAGACFEITWPTYSVQRA
jgi:signal transduction histidine kinase